MNGVERFAYQASYRVMAGLQQEVGLKPGVNYHPRGYNAARVVTLRLGGINPHYLKNVAALRDQLGMWAGLDDQSKIRIGWQGANIILEIPKPQPYWKQVTIETLESRHYIRRGLVATVGLGLQDDPKRIDFKEAALAHVFITGQTRSGKTNAQRLIAWNLARNVTPNDARLIVFDVAKRGYKWRDLNGLAHLAHPVVDSIPEAEGVLAWLAAEIGRRAEKDYTTPAIFCLIDELKALIDDSELAADYLARIASAGGEFGMHLVLATQYPQVKMLGSAEIKRNVTTRLCGKVDDSTAAHNALGIPGSGAESLQGYGDFLLKDFDGLSRLTVAKIEPAHIGQLERGEVGRLPLPDPDDIYSGPPPTRNEPMCVEPEHAALALVEPSGIGSFRDRVVEMGLAESFSKDRAKRTLEFAERQRSFIRRLIPKGPTNLGRAFDFLTGGWVEFEYKE